MTRKGISPNTFPDSVLTSNSGNTARLKVAVGQTGFWEGREFRISEELSIPSATPKVFKFVSPVDFILTFQNLTSDSQGIKFEAFRDNQGTEGGTFTPDALPDGKPVEVMRVKTSGSTAQKTTIGGSISGERGLAAGTYYLKFSNLPASGTADGVYTLVWQEQP